MFLTRGKEDSHQFSPASLFTQRRSLTWEKGPNVFKLQFFVSILAIESQRQTLIVKAQ